MAEHHHARLGLFLVLGAVLACSAAVFYAMRLRQRPAIEFVTWIDESATGLGPGSPVRFRGVEVGRVDHVVIADERLMVEIGFRVDLAAMTAIGVDGAELQAKIQAGGWTAPPNLRVRQVPNLVTGTSYLLIDRMKEPPPALVPSRPLDRPYMPWAQSSVDSMVDQAQATLDRLPRLVDHLDQAAVVLRDQLKAAQVDQLSADLRRIAARAEALLDRVERTVGEAQVPAIAAEVRRLLARSDQAAESIRALAAGEGPAGITMTRAALLLDDLRRLLPQAELTLRQVGQLARSLDEQPEAVIFGPRRETVPGAKP
jgi:ABC-type transporter Mla subunit MlaD